MKRQQKILKLLPIVSDYLEYKKSFITHTYPIMSVANITQSQDFTIGGDNALYAVRFLPKGVDTQVKLYFEGEEYFDGYPDPDEYYLFNKAIISNALEDTKVFHLGYRFLNNL